MKKKKALVRVVDYSEVVGTSWYQRSIIRCSLADLLKVLHLSFSQVDVSCLTDKTRYNLYLKVDGMPAFRIYDVCSFKYGVKSSCEEDFVISWHVGTFNVELSLRVLSFLRDLGLEVSFCCFPF